MIVRTLFFAFLIMVLYAQAQELSRKDFRKMMREAIRTCARSNNITSAMSLEVFNQTASVERKFKCFFNCMLNKFSLVDENGDFKSPAMQTFVNNMPKSKLRESIEKNFTSCLQENSIDPCEKSYRLITCFYRMTTGQSSSRGMLGQQDFTTAMENF